MAEFKSVTDRFAVAAALTREDIARAAVEGFKTLVNNRPDGESPDQLSSAEARAEAEAAGMAYIALPFAGPPPPNVVGQTSDLLEQAQTPVLAFCRSGTRSITAWALASALSGAYRPDEILQKAAAAGYDLSGAREALTQLAPRS